MGKMGMKRRVGRALDDKYRKLEITNIVVGTDVAGLRGGRHCRELDCVLGIRGSPQSWIKELSRVSP
jgi:hypothetical protein